MRVRTLLGLLFASSLAFSVSPTRFSLEQMMSAPFPSDLTAAPKGGAVAWVLDQHGARNIWIAEAPDYKGRRLPTTPMTMARRSPKSPGHPTAAPSSSSAAAISKCIATTRIPPASLKESTRASGSRPSLPARPAKFAEGNQPAVSPKGDRIVFLRKNRDLVSRSSRRRQTLTAHPCQRRGRRAPLVSGRRPARLCLHAHRSLLHRRL